MDVVAQPGQELTGITPGERLIQPCKIGAGPGEKFAAYTLPSVYVGKYPKSPALQ